MTQGRFGNRQSREHPSQRVKIHRCLDPSCRRDESRLPGRPPSPGSPSLLFREPQSSLHTSCLQELLGFGASLHFELPRIGCRLAPGTIITQSVRGLHQEERIPGCTGGTHHRLNVNGARLLSGASRTAPGRPEAASSGKLFTLQLPPFLGHLHLPSCHGQPWCRSAPQHVPSRTQPPPAGQHSATPSSESFGEITMEGCFSGTPFFRNSLLIWGEGWCFIHLVFHQWSSRA